MRARHPVLISFCASLLAISAACTDAVSPTAMPSVPAAPVVRTVTLSPADVTLPTGAHLSVNATLIGADGQPVTTAITWSSSDTTIAAVSLTGEIQAVALGHAVITARAGGAYAAAPVTIVPAVAAESIAVNPQKANVPVGQSLQFSVVLGTAAAGASTGSTVTWSSSNSQVATVSGTGLVTGVSAGIASIRASYQGRTAVAAVTVVLGQASQAIVASVTLDHSSLGMTVGDSTRVTATPRDASGAILDGRAITWSSSNPSVATVSPSGLVTAVAVGAATVTATSEGQTGTMNVTVVAATSAGVPSGNPGSNEPAGMTTVADRNFDSKASSASDSKGAQGWWTYEANYSHTSIASDPSAPRSPSGVMQFYYPGGLSVSSTSSYSPGAMGLGVGSGSRSVYTSVWLKLSANWQGHPTGNQKLFELFYGNSYRLLVALLGSGSRALHFDVSVGNVNLPNNAHDVTLSRGQWHRIEVLSTINASGTSNGVVKWWLDGTLVGDIPGMQFAGGGSSASWTEFKFDPVWGGLGGTISQDMFMYVDHVVIASAR